MAKDKLIFIILFSLILLVGIFAFNYYYEHSIRQISTDSEASDSRAEANDKIVDINKGAIESAQKKTSLDPRKVNTNDHLLGKITAPVQIIAYMDYTDSFCADLSEELSKLFEIFNDKIALVIRHYPMEMNPGSFEAALALECAGEQDKFWEMHSQVFGAIKKGVSGIELYSNSAKDFGLDMDRYNACIEEESIKEKIINQIADADTIGVIGTPTLYINNEVHPGAVPLEDFTDSQGKKREGLESIVKRMLE